MEGRLCSVQTVHVGLVVFAMVKFHDIFRDVWLKGLNAQPNSMESTLPPLDRGMVSGESRLTS